MPSTPGFELRAHLWEASALTTALPLIPRLFSERYSLSIYWPSFFPEKQKGKQLFKAAPKVCNKGRAPFFHFRDIYLNCLLLPFPPPPLVPFLRLRVRQANKRFLIPDLKVPMKERPEFFRKMDKKTATIKTTTKK